MKKLVNSLIVMLFLSSAQVLGTSLPVPASNRPRKSGKTVTVQLIGIQGDELNNVRKILQLKKQSQLPSHFIRKLQVRLAAQSLRSSMIKALQPYGYFAPTIKKNIQSNPTGWSLTYRISLGRPVLYNRIHLKLMGASLPPNAEKALKEQWPIIRGKRFTLSSYNKARNLLVSLATKHGFFSYKMLTAKVSINKQQYTANVDIVFYLGKRYHFGTTHFNSSRLSKHFLERFITYKQNHVYQQGLFDKTRQGMINSLYFSSVNLAAKPDSKTGKVNIKATLHQLPPRSFNIGAGYGTDTGLRGLFSATFNDLNPHGDKLKLLLRGSQVNSALVGSYIIPGFYPPTDKFAITGELSQLDEIPGKSFSRRVAGSYSTKWNHWSFSAELNALKESYDLDNLPKTKTDLLYPEITARYVNADNLLFPSHGFNFSASVSGASKNALSHVSFMQYNVHLRTVQTIWKRLRILLRAHLAYTDIKRIEQLPLSLQLMAGGVDSIRGYDYNSIYDGRELFTGSAELQVKIYGNWYLAGFYDIGNVSDNIFSQRMHASAGPAVLWASPLGALEVSLARTISETPKHWKIQFSVGTYL